MRLSNSEHFPTITASRVGGGEMSIPQDLEGWWAVLLFYRGYWCPCCRQQLLDFQRASEQLSELGAEVVALSVDSLEQAQQTVERHRLTFPVLYGLQRYAERLSHTLALPFLGRAKATMLKPTVCILGGDLEERLGERFFQRLARSGLHASEMSLNLGEHLLNGREIRGIRWQKQHLTSRLLNQLAHPCALMHP